MTYFWKILKYHISWKFPLPLQWQPSCSQRTVRRTEKHVEANSRFSQFCDRAWKWIILSGFAKKVITLRQGTYYPHVTWAHVMLRVQLGCERRFNIEFYGADSHFCHSDYVTWSHVQLWSAHAPARLSHVCCRTHFVRRAGAWAEQSSTWDHVT